MASSSPSPPYTIGALEGASVAFLGSFASTEAAELASTSVDPVHGLLVAVVAGLGAFATFLGYLAYQNS